MSTPKEDPHTIKLMGLSLDITEEDIEYVMSKFGNIEKVKIPFEELRNGSKRRRQFAFVTFTDSKGATRAVEEGEITVEFATLRIERALERARMPMDRGPGKQEFDILKRRT